MSAMTTESNDEKYLAYMRWADANLPLFTKMLVLNELDNLFTDEYLINIVHQNDLGEHIVHMDFFYQLYPNNDAEFSRLRSVVDKYTHFDLGGTKIEPPPF